MCVITSVYWVRLAGATFVEIKFKNACEKIFDFSFKIFITFFFRITRINKKFLFNINVYYSTDKVLPLLVKNAVEIDFVIYVRRCAAS